MIITSKQSIKWIIFMTYNVLVVSYNNEYIINFSDFLLPQKPGATYIIHMTNSLNYYNFIYFFFCLFMTNSILFYDQIICYLMWCMVMLFRARIFVNSSLYIFCINIIDSPLFVIINLLM